MASQAPIWTPGSIWPEVCERLHGLYSSLRRHFGYQPGWWPGSPWQITLSAILVQQCDWTVAQRGMQQLMAHGMHGINELADASAGDVHAAIRSISFAPTKAQRLIAFAARLRELGFEHIVDYLASEQTDVLRSSLLTMPGIGDETADAMLLFAGDSHPTFIIDAYTRRIFSRTELGTCLDKEFWKQSTSLLRSFLQEHLLASLDRYDHFEWNDGVPRQVALFRDYHAQLVELGRHHCLKSKPRCDKSGKQGWTDNEFCRKHCGDPKCIACPLVDVCQHAHRERPSDG